MFGPPAGQQGCVKPFLLDLEREHTCVCSFLLTSEGLFPPLKPKALMKCIFSSFQMKLFVLAVCALLSVAHSEEGARLLASKSLLNRYAVEGKDLTLQYNIYNVGSR